MHMSCLYIRTYLTGKTESPSLGATVRSEVVCVWRKVMHTQVWARMQPSRSLKSWNTNIYKCNDRWKAMSSSYWETWTHTSRCGVAMYVKWSEVSNAPKTDGRDREEFCWRAPTVLSISSGAALPKAILKHKRQELRRGEKSSGRFQILVSAGGGVLIDTYKRHSSDFFRNFELNNEHFHSGD